MPENLIYFSIDKKQAACQRQHWQARVAHILVLDGAGASAAGVYSNPADSLVEAIGHDSPVALDPDCAAILKAIAWADLRAGAATRRAAAATTVPAATATLQERAPCATKPRSTH